MKGLEQSESAIFSDIKQLIIQAKQKAKVAVNASLTMMYWQIGPVSYTHLTLPTRS